MGFSKTVIGKQAQAKMAEKLSERKAEFNRLVEKYSAVKGLGFKNGKLQEMVKKNAKKTETILKALEGTEKMAWNNASLARNALQAQNIKALNESKISEAVQTGAGMALMMPTDIVKIARIGYTNSIAGDVFDVWGMGSMKDSLFKLETLAGSTKGDVTANQSITEVSSRGDYPTTYEEKSATVGTSDTSVQLDDSKIIPWSVEIYDADGNKIGADIPVQDTASKNLPSTGTISGSVTGTVNYTTGVLVLAASASTAVTIRYAYDFEQITSKTGSVVLNLQEYQFNAKFNPMEIEWTQFTQDVMASKMGLDAKEMLVAGAGDAYRKSFDEQALKAGIRATGWDSGVTHNADYSAFGDDSEKAHVETILKDIGRAEAKTYNQLGRMADDTALVMNSNVYTYIMQSDKFVSMKPVSKNGMFKVGELDGRSVYIAPTGAIANDVIYCFGKSETASVDAPVSIGTYGVGVTTPELTHKTFVTEMGLGSYSDVKVLNKYFATKVNISNL